MSIVAIGSNWYKHYHRLTEECQLMTCNRAGVNVDYFTLVVRAAGLVAVPYHREVIDDGEYLNMLGNGTVDVGWALRRQDPALLEKVFFTLPVTGVTYGYVACEDRTKIRDSFTKLFFNVSTIVFSICVLIVNSINIILNYLNFANKNKPPEIRKILGKCTLKNTLKGTYTVIHSASPILKLKRQGKLCYRTLPSKALLSVYLIAVLFFSLFFQSLITSILASDKIVGYDVTSFSALLDKLEWQGFKALIWPKFRLQLYCRGDECARWNQLKGTSTVMAPDTSELYFARLTEHSQAVGFASIGDELLRSDVIIYNRHFKQLFIADTALTRQPFSFTISKKRRDLVEAFNRAIALTSSIYPRIMARYVPPYGVYSRQVNDMVVSPLSVASFDAIWQFLIICMIIIFTAFILELIAGFIMKRLGRR